MKRHFKVFLFIATMSSITIFSQTISREVIEGYNKFLSGISVPSTEQICYQLANR